MNILKKKSLTILPVLALIVSLALLLVSCDNGNKPAETNTDVKTTATDNADGEAATTLNDASDIAPSEDPKDSEQANAPKDDFVSPMPEQEGETEDGHPIIKAGDFSLTDQFGNRHSLKDYQGKVVVLNFWQSWCGPCKMEMPDFQEVYEKDGKNQEDVVILGIQSPKNPLNTIYNQESLDADGIAQFLKDNGYTYPTLMDYTGEMFINHAIQSFPTTYFINPEGYIYGLVPGMIDKNTLTQLIDETKNYTIH